MLIPDAEYDVITSSVTPSGKYNKFNQNENQITLTKDGTCGFVSWQNKKFWLADGSFVLKPKDNINNKYLFYCLKSNEQNIESMELEAPIPHLYKKHLYQLEIPVPSLEKQNQIVNIISLLLLQL